MELDFTPNKDALYIPPSVYKLIKRCPFCQSVYLNDKDCETCGRVLNYDYIGFPFSHKSYFGLKEKYVASFSLFIRLFPVFENRNSPQTSSYKRNLQKRYKDLILGLSSTTLMKLEDRKFFLVEIQLLIREMLDYGLESKELIDQIFHSSNEDFSLNHLVAYINDENLKTIPHKNAFQVLLEYKLLGVMKVETFLRLTIFMATLIFVAMKLRYVFIKN